MQHVQLTTDAIRPAILRLPEVIDEVMSEVEPLIEGTRLEVSRNLSPDLPEIETDRQKVKQIVLNLLSNALKFTPEGSVAIRLEHECLHYLTYRLSGMIRSNVLDELVADFAGLVAATGKYSRDLAIRFLGLVVVVDRRPGRARAAPAAAAAGTRRPVRRLLRPRLGPCSHRVVF